MVFVSGAAYWSAGSGEVSIAKFSVFDYCCISSWIFRKGGDKLPRPSVLIFDLGKVLVDYEEIYLVEELMKRCDASPGELAKYFTQEGSFFELERGRISEEVFFPMMKSSLGYVYDAGELQADFCRFMKFALMRDSLDLLQEMRNGHGGDTDFWLLSNLCSPHYKCIRAHMPGIFASFRRVFVSCEMGSRKPEEEIYMRALDEGGVKAEDCLFTDDRRENCDAAERLGMRAVLFEGAEKLRISLRSFGFNV